VIPWFIFFFIIALVFEYLYAFPTGITHGIVAVSKQSLTLTLFFIGAGLSRSALKMVGVKPFILGVTLWFLLPRSAWHLSAFYIDKLLAMNHNKLVELPATSGIIRPGATGRKHYNTKIVCCSRKYPLHS